MRSKGRNRSPTNAVDDHGTAKIWGIASRAALVAMLLWCVVAAGFIVWVALQRKRRAAHRHSSRVV